MATKKLQSDKEQMAELVKVVEANEVLRANAAEPLVLSAEEIQAIKAIREGKRIGTVDQQVGVNELAKALIIAIETTRPPQKKNPFNRKKGNPWLPKDGSPKPKLKRTWYQHGMEIDATKLYSEEIELLNKAKPGLYAGGLVAITKRRDRGYDISWPVRTAAQRLRVINEAGATLPAILRRCIDEYNDPVKYKGPEDDDE